MTTDVFENICSHFQFCVPMVHIFEGDREEYLAIDGVTWQEYENLLARLGDRPSYRLTYLDETLEIVSPSRRHEFRKKNLSRLLEIYLEETRTPFWGLGSMTLREQARRGGIEPNECYCIGTDKEVPDLAIEAVVTSGRIDRLEVYKRLGTAEVWFWEGDRVRVYCLRNNSYDRVSTSQVLPDLNLDLLARYALDPNPLAACLAFREAVREMRKED